MSGPFLSVASRPRRRARRVAAAAAFVGGILLLLAIVVGAVAVLDRGSLPAGTTIGGVDVGGMSDADARAAVQRVASARADRPIHLVAPGGVPAETNVREFRAEPLVEHALAEARSEGTFGRLLARAGLRDGPRVALVYRLAPVAAAKLADQLDDRFGEPWRDARYPMGREATVSWGGPS